jgi:O-glycosyl hydrolase
MNKLKTFTFAALLLPILLTAQTTVTFDASIKYQTMQGFGGSDAWNIDPVGKYWGLAVKNSIAQKLFDKSFDANGNPLGIGLSRWRFNIGAGSAEQADATIGLTERRVECFLNADSSYNWNKQAGQQWFLKQAKKYGVEQLVAFINSPPRFYTKSGRANSDNTDNFGLTNLKDGHYDNFANFITTVLKHFEDSSIHFSQISPINEPQYPWNKDQEGCPWKNSEVKTLIVELNKSILNKGLTTKILLSEAASYKDLYMNNSNAEKSDQVSKFFSSANTEYIGGYSQVLHGLGGHSYWTDGDDATIKSVRESFYAKAKTIDNSFETYQTEYNLLSKDYNDYLKNSIFLGKMIYSDLTYANVSIWDYWTVIERERWSQKNRFYLMRLVPTGGDYGELNTGGTITVDKNLWVLGNFSRFIRPGYKRIKTAGASDMSGLMGVAFIAPDNSKIVIVYVNWSSASIRVSNVFSNLPANFSVSKITPYITDVNYNLSVNGGITKDSVYSILPQSVTTLVVDLSSTTDNTSLNVDNSGISIFPMPSNGLFRVQLENIKAKNPLNIMDVNGKRIYSKMPDTCSPYQTIDISDKPSGIYFLTIGNIREKIVKL